MLFLDVPNAPEGPLEVTDLTEKSATLSWKPPKSDGGSPLTAYIIEVRDARRTTWKKVGETKPTSTEFTVRDLALGNEYVFQVFAVNKEGQSSPLQTTENVKPTKEISKCS